MTQTNNARFWVAIPVHGRKEISGFQWVKITLKPFQLRHHWVSVDHDEGFTALGITWEHTGSGVHMVWLERNRDCDGLHETVYDSWCSLEELASVESDGVMRPDWQDTQQTHNDRRAEAAGY